MRNGTILTQPTTAFGVLGGHEVAGASLEMPELAGSGLLEPLCGTFSCFELRHCFHLSFLMMTPPGGSMLFHPTPVQ
jgi:hypothetical protein